ncbi:group III truncated hemoglobin [Pedobacter sp. SYSU D00535]|uniref:group III truncated hemoglobin n=1 Tax=Pedobacter sp. SYSU D00535 TaxID=2810308 RepID=UPI001A96F57C|nr:group III truncated hemoglobin [Pedobacter sp. SYSU D00535]
MTEKRDITERADIELMLNNFYGRVRNNELLGPIFNSRIGDRWPEHLDKMYRFWETVLLNEHSYGGSPFLPHASMQIDASHFAIWKSLFIATVDQLFAGPTANTAKWRAELMAELFNSKIEYSRKSGFKPIQ